MGVAGFSAQPANAQTANAQIDRRATLGRPIILTIKPRSYLMPAWLCRSDHSADLKAR